MDQLVEIKSKIQINPSRVGLKYFIKTFGCQMNEHDSERISGMFELDGMSKASSEEFADILFVNTCTIRENADDKLYGTLGHLKQWQSERNNRSLLVGGCAEHSVVAFVLVSIFSNANAACAHLDHGESISAEELISSKVR